MKRLSMLVFCLVSLTGCYESAPDKSDAADIAKQEVSMALCGDRAAGCISKAVGDARVGERLNDHTNKITVSFSKIIATPLAIKGEKQTKFTGGGFVSYVFDAKNGDTYVKEISLWSEDGAQLIDLCGHNYTFCTK